VAVGAASGLGSAKRSKIVASQLYAHSLGRERVRGGATDIEGAKRMV
jgi:hypothetical protein